MQRAGMVLPQVRHRVLQRHRLDGLGGGAGPVHHALLRWQLPSQLQAGEHAHAGQVAHAPDQQGGTAGALLRADGLRAHGADALRQQGEADLDPVRRPDCQQVSLRLRVKTLAARKEKNPRKTINVTKKKKKI